MNRSASGLTTMVTTPRPWRPLATGWTGGAGGGADGATGCGGGGGLGRAGWTLAGTTSGVGGRVTARAGLAGAVRVVSTLGAGALRLPARAHTAATTATPAAAAIATT